MAGEKQTSRALQPAWQGTLGPTDTIHKPVRCRVAVVGVGEIGNKTITRLTEIGVKDAYTVAINTDSPSLNETQADRKILIGKKSTRGLKKNEPFALRKQIEDSLTEADVVFVTTSLGDRTGMKITPLVAEIAKKKCSVTIGVVTKPFRAAKSSSRVITTLKEECDTLVVVDNSKLTAGEALRIADQVLSNVIKNIVETLATPSLISFDLDNFKTMVKRGGIASVGIGESDASNRAEEAVHNALRSPLLGDYTGATGVLVYVTGDGQMTAEEANHVGEIVAEMMNNDAQVIWGARVDPELHGKIRVTLLLTGVNAPRMSGGLDLIAPQLFDLEPYSTPEKKLPIDLGLYQLENFES